MAVDTSTEAVTKLMDGVTPGPWTVRLAYDEDRAVIDGTGFPVAYDVASADRHFIAAAHDLVPALLAERDALKKERDEAIEGWHVIHPNITVQDAAKVPEIAALMDARRRYIELVEKYNAKLHSVKAQRLRGDWSQDVTTEFREMIEAHQNFIAAAQTAADAALRAIAEG